MKLHEFWDSVNNYEDIGAAAEQLGSLEARLAFQSGMESFQNGTPILKNPYNHGARARAWNAGWKSGYLKKHGKEYSSTPSPEPNHPSSDAGSSNG